MNASYAQQHRFFNDSEGVREGAEAVSHADLGGFFSKYVAGTDEIPWDDFFRSVGLRVVAVSNAVPDAGFTASHNFDGPMSVNSIAPASDAERAGLQVGDIIVELQGKPVGRDFRQELARLSPGDTIAVKVRGRRGGDREMKWKIGSRQEISYQVKDLDQITPQQRARRAAWLKGEAESSSAAGSIPANPEPARP
jgi:predicted metalloprotease with PDZ domain